MDTKHTYLAVPPDSDLQNPRSGFEMTNITAKVAQRHQNDDPENPKGNGFLKTKLRKYEVFPGRNRFCCGGRIMLATQTGIFYFTLFLILGTSACFFATDTRYSWEYMHPVVPIFGGLLCIFVVVVLCRTALGDPGIIPRASPAEAAALERLIEEEQATEQAKATSTLPYRPPPRVRDVTVNGRQYKLKFCFTCKIFRPPRASHCSVCDNCVDRFDHHCPWVGNCVGRRNYKYFYLFLTSLTVYCAYLLAVSVAAIALRSKEFGFPKAMEKGPLSPVVAVIAFFSIWSVAGLGGFHTYLVALNITTNEDIKGTFKKRNGGNPYSTGSCLTNCSIVLCGPNPPSLLDRRGWVSEHDLPPVDKPSSGISAVVAGYNTTSTEHMQPANTNSNASAAATSGPEGAVGLSASAGGVKADINAYSTTQAGHQSRNSETLQISNGRNHSKNPQKYLPPIEHHHASQVSNQNREYLT